MLLYAFNLGTKQFIPPHQKTTKNPNYLEYL